MLKMKTVVFITTLFICMINVEVYSQSDSVIKLMQSHLVIKGKKPVYSIQTYISKEDKIFCEAVGVSDGKKKNADRDNQFKIASITKTMTATIILQLQEEGLTENFINMIRHFSL